MLVAGALVFIVSECVVVVVVAGAGFSTTVVHEVKATAIARIGVRIISFFIVEVVSFPDNSAQMPQPDVFRAKIFGIYFALVVDA